MFEVFKRDNMVEEVKIKDMRLLVTTYSGFVNKQASLDDIAKMMIANPSLKSIYVLDDKLKLVGRVTLKKLIKHEFMNLLPSSFECFDALDFIGNKTADEIMTAPVYVKDDDTLKTAFVKMYENDLEELPVVDDNLHLIGNIDLIELLTILIEKKEQKANKDYLRLIINRPFHR
jgi:CBS domain-containing protein